MHDPQVGEGALAGLRRMAPPDFDRYRAALAQAPAQAACWQHYLPFLHFHYGPNPRQDLLIEEHEGALCLFKLDRREDPPQLRLFCLPLPAGTAALRHCLERVRAFNGQPRVAIDWMPAAQIGALGPLGETLRLVPKLDQYLYDPKLYRHLTGRKTRELRHNLAHVQALEGVEVQAYTPQDAPEAEALLATWIAQQRAKYDTIAYQGYTRACLRHDGLFGPRELAGKVVRVQGRLCAFGFAGEIRPGLANLFITYSDPGVSGLNRFLTCQLLQAFEDCELVNSGPADTPGLVTAKDSLCPVAMQQVFRVTIGA